MGTRSQPIMAIAVFESLRLLFRFLRYSKISIALRHLIKGVKSLWSVLKVYLFYHRDISFVTDSRPPRFRQDHSKPLSETETKHSDNLPICASRTPSSSITAPVADHSSDVDYTVQPPSGPPSFASTPEAHNVNLEPTLLCPYPPSTRDDFFSSNDIPRTGLLSEHELRRSTSRLNRYPVRPSSRASSRIHTHHGTGIYTVRSSVDLPRELGLSQVEIGDGDFADKANPGGEFTLVHEGRCIRRYMNPTMVVERYNRNILL